MILLIFSMIVAGIFLYKRYIPVSNVKVINPNMTNVTVVDIRDFNESYKSPIPDAVNVPTAYLKRYHREIPDSDLHIIASGKLEMNLGIRYLRKKGYRIVGCSIRNEI